MKKNLFFLMTSIVLAFGSGCNEDEDSDIILTNYDWEVKEIRLGDYMEMTSETYVLHFKENTFTLGLDVNQCGGEFEIIDDSNIRFFTIACTEACCDSKFAQNLITILGTIKTYDLDSDELKLEDGDDFIELNKLP